MKIGVKCSAVSPDETPEPETSQIINRIICSNGKCVLFAVSSIVWQIAWLFWPALNFV